MIFLSKGSTNLGRKGEGILNLGFWIFSKKNTKNRKRRESKSRVFFLNFVKENKKFSFDTKFDSRQWN